MNENERGITPPDVTAMTLEHLDAGGWRVTIEQGNGDVLKTIGLTEMERVQLGLMLSYASPVPCPVHVSFVDFDRGRAEPYPAGRTA